MKRAAADLHVHSRYSNRPTEWLLRRLGAPECYTDPLVVYRRARERGMTLVTLTDHDTIDGALEIAHLPGAFISCEVTVRFPEDGCAFHLLVFGIDQEQHREIQRLRDNVYELRDYLYDHAIAHSVAHLLYGVDGTLQLAHVEKLVVLFKCFEGLNGEHDARVSTLTRAVLNNLTPRQIDELADRHRLDPRDGEAWRKHMTAGSDDHCGLYVATAWSSVAAVGAVTPRSFLEALRNGDLSIEGAAGSSTKLGRGLHSIAARYARSHGAAGENAMGMMARIANGIERAGEAFGADCEPRTPTGPVVSFASAAGTACVTAEADGDDQSAGAGFPAFVGDAVRAELAAPRDSDHLTAELASFRLATRLGQRLTLEGLWRSIAALRAGDLATALDAGRAALPAAFAVAPYFIAWRSHHRDEPLRRAVADRFPAARLLRERSGRTVWFRDALDGNDARSTAALDLAIEIAGGPDRLRVVQLHGAELPNSPFATAVFRPMGDLGVLDLGASPLAIPPLLDLVEHCERERFDRVITTGVGPMAAAARVAAWCLELDFLAALDAGACERFGSAIGGLLPDSAISSYLRWLFATAREIRVADDETLARLDLLGISPDRLRARAVAAPAGGAVLAAV